MFFRKCCCGKNNRKIMRSVPILVLGLDSAGKSSIIKRIQGESVISVVPTVGFNRVRINYSSQYEIFLYDLGGGENFRTIWKQYLGTAYGVIYVVDSNDFQRIEENRQVFEQLLSDDNMRYKPLLLLANKQDLEAALDEVDIVERLNVHSLVNSHRCPTTIELCSALEPPTKPGKCCAKSKHPPSDGVQTGFRWLMKQIDEYYEDLQLRIEEVMEREQREYALKREKWKEEKRRREEDEKEEEEETGGENGNPFRPVDEILSAKNLSNGFKTSVQVEQNRDETNVSNFQIRNSCENLLENDLNNSHEGGKKKQPKRRKKKVAPLNADDTSAGTELPPLRIPARNVNMAWTEETQINNEDAKSRDSTVEEVEDLKRDPVIKSEEAIETERER